MAIEKNKIRVSRFDREEEDSPRSSNSMSSEEGDEFRHNNSLDSDDDDDDEDFNDADSGAGSDDFDLLELGETGAEFCQVGDSTFSIPLDLYDLPDLTEVLSLDVWNDCLTEEERFDLVKYLPDMDMETYMRTLKDLFSSSNFHFGSPLVKLFDMLKGGLCEPRVALYRQGLQFFQKRQHCHLVRKHHNSMVSNLCQIRDAWINYRGYSIEEKLRVLNIMKTQRSLMNEKMEDMEADSDSSEELGDGSRRQKGMDRKFGQRVGGTPGYDSSSAFEFPSRGRPLPRESVIYGKPHQKGLMKLPNQKAPYGKESMGNVPSIHFGFEARPGPYSSSFPLHRQNKAAVYDSGAALKIRGQMRGDDDLEQTIYEVALSRDRNIPRSSAMDNFRALKAGKKKGDEFVTDGFVDPSLPVKNDPLFYARSKDVNQLSDIKVLTSKPSKTGVPYNFGKKSKYTENIQQHAFGDRKMKHGKGRVPGSAPGDGLADSSDRPESFWSQKMQEEAFSMDSSSRYNNLSGQGQKWNLGRVSSPDLNLNSHVGSSPQVEERLFHSNYRAKSSKDGRMYPVQNGGLYNDTPRGMQTFLGNDETESDSSDHINKDHVDEEDGNTFSKGRLSYSGSGQRGSRSLLMKPSLDPTHPKFIKKTKKESALTIEGGVASRKGSDFGDQLHMAEIENYTTLKEMQKGKLRGSASRAPDVFSAGSASLNDDLPLRGGYRAGKNNQLQGQFGERSYVSSLRSNVGESQQSKEFDEEDYSVEVRAMKKDKVLQGRLGKKGHSIQGFGNDGQAVSDMHLLGCNSMNKKRKVKEDSKHVNDLVEYEYHLDDDSPLSKLSKVKSETDVVSLDPEVSEPPTAEMETTILEEAKPAKKPFTLITPTVHTGFSFSIIHLLSAVRMAMTTPHPEDDLQVSQHLEKSDDKLEEHNKGTSNGVESHEDMEAQTSGQPVNNVPSLTVQEIVNRVRSNPGDPCILETQEPLQDLIRGVMKIFSCKTAPLGAKSWKPLVSLEKSTKSWSWIGPVSHTSSDYETIEEVTSPEAWGLPHKMLVKLVDAFANWLKSGQETLQQIGSLPAPPAELTQFNVEEKDRFKDLRAQKSLITITPSSEEVRAYFRKEEVLRYSIPDRAFSYTALDGKKSIVAPLRRCGGKPTSKARDHFMLKRDRPPHVTILCLVRDAAARMPGSIGTRADVCTLIRDSQFIVEDVSDAQVNQIVSGALDRLHYERDPCVQFDGERKLWVYLHRDREEEDFEDDGTSSTKKWKRPKKDSTEQLDQGAVTVAYHGNGDQAGAELCSDLNAEPSMMDEDKRGDRASDDARTSGEDVVGTPQGAELSSLQQNDLMVWEPVDLSTNALGENKILCQENSTNEDFDDEVFGKDRPTGLIGAALL